MITFVGAGPGAEDLITVRGQRLLQDADIVVYAGSLVNPGLLSLCREDCRIYNSAVMTLEEVLDVMTAGYRDGKEIVRLHTGDPLSLRGHPGADGRAGSTGHPLRGLPRRELLLRRGGVAGCGIYASGYFSVRGDHQDGRAHPGAGERVHRIFCSPSGDYGSLFKYGDAERTLRRTDPGRISGGTLRRRSSIRLPGRKRRCCAVQWIHWRRRQERGRYKDRADHSGTDPGERI